MPEAILTEHTITIRLKDVSVHRDLTIQLPPAEPHRVDRGSRDRRDMIEKVWANWITGWLQASLPQDLLLDLGLTERPAMVTRPLDLLVQRLDLADEVQAPGTQLIDVFNRLDRALLILGAPGAGKTTLLLQLAQHLLRQAAQDPQQPIPVVLLLSSWAQQRLPLADWLVDALNEHYEIPRKIGQAWIEADEILPLLDGLDEVKVEHRAACVEAINRFRREHGLVPLVVCSRSEAYEALGTPLRLQGALSVQPLTRADVDTYLAQVGAPLAAVRQAVQDDPTLWELLDTPLMLEVVTLACAGEAGATFPMQGTLAERRRHLFTIYVDRMFRRRKATTAYTRQQTERWLAWLAVQMTQHGQTVFYLERMQLTWLPYRLRSKLRNFGKRTAIRVGLLIFTLAMLGFGPLVGFVIGLAAAAGVFVGSVRSLNEISEKVWRRVAEAGICVEACRTFKGIGQELRRHVAAGGSHPDLMPQEVLQWALTSEDIISVETLRWSWSALAPWQWYLLLIYIPLSGLSFGLFVGLSWGGAVGLFAGVAETLFLGLVIITGGALASSEIETKTVPNQGIRRSARNAVLSGLAGGLVGGLAGGLLAILGYGLGFKSTTQTTHCTGFHAEPRASRRDALRWVHVASAP